MKYTLWLLQVCCVFVYGQEQIRVEGRVLNSNGESVPIGDILLLNEEKSNLIEYTTLADGHFELDEISKGKYWLEVSALGYERYVQEVDFQKDVKILIELQEQVAQLENVEVVALQNPITTTNGNLKINVKNPIFSSMADPMEVLSKLPNIQISPDGESMSVINKGNPLIYLGNQRITLEEFTGLSVDAIESIELINNPSSKYEAEGRAVILIKLAKNTKKGAYLSINETLSFRQNTNNYISSNGSFSNEKWNLRANLNYNNIGQWESHTFKFGMPSQDIFSDYLVIVLNNIRTQIQGGLGVYVPLNDEDYVSFNTTLKLQTDDAPIVTDTFLQNGTETDQIFTDTNNDNSKDYFSGNFNFNKRLSPKLIFFTGLQFSSFIQKLDSEIMNNYNNEGFVLDQIRKQEYEIGSLAMRTDFEYDLSAALKSEFGASWNEANATAYTRIEEPASLNEAITEFDYKESLYATYVDFKSNMDGWFNFTIGARAEYNTVAGTLKNDGSTLVDRQHMRFFPKTGLNFELDSTKTVSFNYARSISRPNFSRTSTITVFINPFLEGSNNRNLLPTVNNEVSTNISLKDKNITMGFYRNENPIYYTISYTPPDTVAIFSPTNFEKETGFYLGMTLPFSHKIWTSTNTINLNYNKITDPSTAIAKAKPYLYAYSNHQLKVAKDTIVAAGGWLLTKRQEGIYKRNAMVVLNASVTKTFFEKLQCSLRFNDITKAMNYEESYTVNGVEANGVYFADAREVALSVKYKFGGDRSMKFKNKVIDENLDRIK
ncbi:MULTISPECIES: TonB-dependent receptor [Flavobacteriaceae]|uniref:TonB-dependent receptor n=1 Tax=Flavobacteriaceae TaxID=49546 RepID=UPI0014914DC8|nr:MULTISPECIES: TonB-dependent receptor [Allomuricauda]MDC6365811.1 TonB-dependent receptor [Muricauda sp. AC10]